MVWMIFWGYGIVEIIEKFKLNKCNLVNIGRVKCGWFVFGYEICCLFLIILVYYGKKKMKKEYMF